MNVKGSRKQNQTVSDEVAAVQTVSDEVAAVPHIQSLFEMRFRTDYPGETVAVRRASINGLLEIYPIME